MNSLSQFSRATKKTFYLILLAMSVASIRAAELPALSNATILIIRHAEKSATGSGLAVDGEKRAQAYAQYFQDFTIDGKPLRLDCIIASADSKKSRRQRLTLEPLSKATSIAIDQKFKNKEFKELANALQSEPHGKSMIICWHHREIPGLVRALQGDPKKVLPDGKWPENTFNWIIELRYDAAGKLIDSRRIQENLMPWDKAAKS